MESGKLRHRIQLQYETEIPNATGELDRTWSSLADVWAAVEPLSGKELIDAQQVASAVTHRARIRYRADLNETCRVRFGNEVPYRYFDINAIINKDERNHVMELLCTEATT